MNLPALVTILIASVAVAACGGRKLEHSGVGYDCPIGANEKINSREALIKAKIEIAGSLPNIEVVDLRCSKRANLLRIDVDMRNESREERRIAYRFRWLDKEGMRAWDDESWKPLVIYGNTLYTVTTLSPSQEATDFRVVVMDQDK